MHGGWNLDSSMEIRGFLETEEIEALSGFPRIPDSGLSTFWPFCVVRFFIHVFAIFENFEIKIFNFIRSIIVLVDARVAHSLQFQKSLFAANIEQLNEYKPSI